jgi:8-oxo-dGTP pyrophosphatase MutT (NUDIX family)
VSSFERLREQLALIEPVDEREATSRMNTIDRLTWPGNPFDEDENVQHVTASAFVISSRGIILHRHRRLNIWVQPGGHVDEGESPEVAAIRETLEETGLATRHLDPVLLFHVDVHPGPRGHTHFDLRYVLVASPLDPSPPDGESPDVFWFDFEAAQQRCEPALAPAIAKLAEATRTFDVRDSLRE